jgi:hypothetical protein
MQSLLLPAALPAAETALQQQLLQLQSFLPASVQQYRWRCEHSRRARQLLLLLPLLQHPTVLHSVLQDLALGCCRCCPVLVYWGRCCCD